MTKRCYKCQRILPTESFYKHSRRGDGLQSECKKCRNKLTSLWAKKYYKTPQGKAKAKANRQNYYQHNKKKIMEIINAYNRKRDEGLYHKYYSMRSRCNSPTHSKYKYYGGKGIKVEWKTYHEFHQDMYADYIKHRRKYGHRNTTIDRIDPHKGYSKENCKWATYKQQRSHLGFAVDKNYQRI